MNPDYEITQNDSGVVMLSTLYDATGAAVDLTTASLLVFHMEQLDETHVAAAGSTAIINASAGQVSYTWASADTVTAEFRQFEWRVTFGGGKVVSFPTDPKLLLRIVPAVS